METFLFFVWLTITLITYVFLSPVVKEAFKEIYPDKDLSLYRNVMLLVFCSIPVLHLMFFITGYSILDEDKRADFIQRVVENVKKRL